MIKLYFTIKLLIPLLLITLGVLFILLILLKVKLDSIFKKNCYNCKHYGLFDVASVGGRCRYKCNKYNRFDSSDMNCYTHYEKCKEFDTKEGN